MGPYQRLPAMTAVSRTGMSGASVIATRRSLAANMDRMGGPSGSTALAAFPPARSVPSATVQKGPVRSNREESTARE